METIDKIPAGERMTEEEMLDEICRRICGRKFDEMTLADYAKVMGTLRAWENKEKTAK